MTKVTWLGEDEGDVPGPSFTTAYGGIKFPKGVPVEVTNADAVRRAERNPYFEVEAEAPADEPPEGDDDQQDDDHEDPTKGLNIADLREMAVGLSIDHAGVGKVELRNLIRERLSANA